MKTKLFGFTLIELLVVIVILGILATISVGTFQSYFGKARDVERRTTVANVAMMIKVDHADVWGASQYVYTDFYALDIMLRKNDFKMPVAKNNRRYY